jgi:hypothetical protein
MTGVIVSTELAYRRRLAAEPVYRRRLAALLTMAVAAAGPGACARPAGDATGETPAVDSRSAAIAAHRHCMETNGVRMAPGPDGSPNPAGKPPPVGGPGPGGGVLPSGGPVPGGGVPPVGGPGPAAGVPPAGGPGAPTGPGGMLPKPPGVSDVVWTKALKACAALAPTP